LKYVSSTSTSSTRPSSISRTRRSDLGLTGEFQGREFPSRSLGFRGRFSSLWSFSG